MGFGGDLGGIGEGQKGRDRRGGGTLTFELVLTYLPFYFHGLVRQLQHQRCFFWRGEGDME